MSQIPLLMTLGSPYKPISDEEMIDSRELWGHYMPVFSGKGKT